MNPTESAYERLPLADLVGRVIQNVRTIFRAEMQLAGAELKEKLRKSTKAGIFLGGAALAGFLAAECLVATCIVVLSIVLPVWLSTLVIGVALGAAAGGAFLVGRMALQEIDPIPQQAVESLRDLADWAETRSRQP